MSVSIQLDKPRELKFDLRALQDLEAAMGGVPLASVVGQLAQISITGIITALWAGLKHEDRALNTALVRKLVEAHLAKGRGLKPLADALAEAINETGIFGAESSTADDDAEDDEGNVRPDRPTVSH